MPASQALSFLQALASFLHLTVLVGRERVDEGEAWLGILLDNMLAGRSGYLFMGVSIILGPLHPKQQGEDVPK